jgi:hypothetical protein
MMYKGPLGVHSRVHAPSFYPKPTEGARLEASFQIIRMFVAWLGRKKTDGATFSASVVDRILHASDWTLQRLCCVTLPATRSNTPRLLCSFSCATAWLVGFHNGCRGIGFANNLPPSSRGSLCRNEGIIILRLASFLDLKTLFNFA